MIVLLLLSLLLTAGTAGAAIVTYTVDTWGPTQFPGPVTPPANAPWGPNGYPGDTVELQTYTGSLDLTPGTYTQQINTVLWTVNYTYAGTATDPTAWSQLLFDIDATRSMTVGTATGVLSQGGLLNCNWDTDYLSFFDGSTTSFIVQGYQVDVTPISLAPSGAGGSSNPPWVQPPQDMMARFDVTAIPEPATIIVWSLLGSASWLGMRVVRQGRRVGRQPWSDENRTAILGIIGKR
jgi:hypothetical protein